MQTTSQISFLPLVSRSPYQPDKTNVTKSQNFQEVKSTDISFGSGGGANPEELDTIELHAHQPPKTKSTYRPSPLHRSYSFYPRKTKRKKKNKTEINIRRLVYSDGPLWGFSALASAASPWATTNSIALGFFALGIAGTFIRLGVNYWHKRQEDTRQAHRKDPVKIVLDNV